MLQKPGPSVSPLLQARQGLEASGPQTGLAPFVSAVGPAAWHRKVQTQEDRQAGRFACSTTYWNEGKEQEQWPLLLPARYSRKGSSASPHRSFERRKVLDRAVGTLHGIAVGLDRGEGPVVTVDRVSVTADRIHRVLLQPLHCMHGAWRQRQAEVSDRRRSFQPWTSVLWVLVL
jgi:hypothetical protein